MVCPLSPQSSFLSIMSCNECSICFDDINASTGSTTLSCGHVFHFNCIARWFANSDDINCALCRKQMVGDKEGYVHEGEYDDEDEDDEDDEDEDEEEWGSTAEDRLKRELLRKRFSLMDANEARTLATTKIQSAWRRFVVFVPAQKCYYAKLWKEKCEKRLQESMIEYKVAQQALRLGQNRWKKQVVTKVQAIWRGHKERKSSPLSSPSCISSS